MTAMFAVCLFKSEMEEGVGDGWTCSSQAKARRKPAASLLTSAKSESLTSSEASNTKQSSVRTVLLRQIQRSPEKVAKKKQ